MTILRKIEVALRNILLICAEFETIDDSLSAVRGIETIANVALAQLDGQVGLTPRQAICKQAIADYTEQHGYAPTMNDLAALMGLASRGYVCRIVKLLVERGHVRHLSGKARSLEVL